eukprot:scaffold314857_cov37-Prasinocladus_malaysianus.AAC.1
MRASACFRLLVALLSLNHYSIHIYQAGMPSEAEGPSGASAAAAGLDPQQATINVKLVEAHESTARRMSTLETHTDEMEAQFSSEMNDWTGKLVETQEMVSDRLGSLESQTDELMRGMNRVHRVVASLQDDMDGVRAELAAGLANATSTSTSGAAAPTDEATTVLAEAQEAMSFRLQSLERQAAKGLDPGEFHGAVNTIMKMFGDVEADVEQLRVDVIDAAAAAAARSRGGSADDNVNVSGLAERLEALGEVSRTNGEAQAAVAAVVSGLRAEVDALKRDVVVALRVSSEAAETSAKEATDAVDVLHTQLDDSARQNTAASPNDVATLNRLEALEATLADLHDGLAVDAKSANTNTAVTSGRLDALEASLQQAMQSVGDRLQQLEEATSQLGASASEPERASSPKDDDVSARRGQQAAEAAEATAKAAVSMAESALQAATAGIKELRDKISNVEVSTSEKLEAGMADAKERLDVISSALGTLRREVEDLRQSR